MTDELTVRNADITLRVEVTGEGPTILCVPGWPELASSWRHQVAHLARRGYRVAALDVRGYGGSSAPPEIGALHAARSRWRRGGRRHRARRGTGHPPRARLGRPDRVAHGYSPPRPGAGRRRIERAPHATEERLIDRPVQPPLLRPVLLHALFQEPGVAEAAFDADLRGAFKRVYHALSGSAAANSLLVNAPRGAALLPLLPDPPDGPLTFLPDAELDRIVASFKRTGMTGSFNRYRALALDVKASSDIVGATVDHPSCFIAGERDPVRAMVPGVDSYAKPGAGCTDFRGATLIAGAGHWVQQEAPSAVNDALDAFLRSI